jgi:hypothetical protein
LTFADGGRKVRAVTTLRRSAALVTLALAAPALAYIPPATTVLREAAKRRDETQPASVEARGSIRLGDAAPIPATLWVKSPGRCRLEIALPGASPAERPMAVVRSGKLANARAMESAPAAVAIAQAACALLAGPRGPAADRGYAQALAQHGVAVASVSLGHLGPSIAWVLGGPARGTQPQAWIEKQQLRPLRLIAELGGERRDVRLLEWTGEPKQEFPHVIEVHSGDVLEARFAVERTIPNPRVPDSMF